MRLSSFFIKQAIKGAYKLPFFELARHSSFFIPFIPFRPVEACINVTENCNSKCITCSAWENRSTDDLTTAEITQILAQLRELGITYLNLTGGEPLLRQDLPYIIGRARELKFKKIQLSTNAILLTREKAQGLLDCGLTTIDVAVDGTEDTHDVIRGVKGSYQRCIGALKMLTELCDKEYPHIEIKMQTTLMQPTFGQILELVNMCKQLNIAFALNLLDTTSYLFRAVTTDLRVTEQGRLDQVINELHKMRRAYPGLVNETYSSLEYARNYFLDPKREDIPCYLGYLAIYIGAHGEVYSACNALPLIGNLRDEPLEQIIGSKAYKKRLHNMFMKRCAGCSCNHKLNLYAHFPAVLEEVLWKLRLRDTK